MHPKAENHFQYLNKTTQNILISLKIIWLYNFFPVKITKMTYID